ncbi:lipoprotein [Streptomyces deserti]
MRTRTTTAATAALTAAVALLLAGCGGGDSQDSGSDKIAGADTGSSSAKPSTSATADTIERPEIKLPKDVVNVFEDTQTGDAKKDAVLADNERRINSIDEAITVDAPKHPALAFYSKDDALLSAASYIKSFYDDGRSFTGKTRYYDREVTFLKDGAAAVTYCMDATQTYPKDRKTGKVDRSVKASPSDYVFYNTLLEKNAKGVWQTTSVTSTEAAKRCM